MNKLFYQFSCLISLLLVLSCGTAKNLPSGTEAEEISTTALIKKINSQNPVFSHLTIQSKIDADIDDTRVGLNGKIYIKNGEKIWVNVSKLGLTAARAEITPNGFRAYEKLNRTYIDGDFSYFNNLLKVDFIDYQKLQSLLLGRVFTDINPKDFKYEIIANQYVMSYADNDKIMKHPKAGKYYQQYVFDNEYKMLKALLKDPSSGMELEVDFSGWTAVGPQFFPKNVKVLVKDKKTQKVQLEYNNFTFEESPTPFTIPSGYKPNGLLK